MGTGYGGGGKPGIGVDMENGIYGGPASNDSFLHAEFVTAMGKGGTNGFATKGANASAGQLQSLHDGPRPKGYQPMHKTGAIILGVGGDNIAGRRINDRSSNAGLELYDRSSIPGMSIGTFYGEQFSASARSVCVLPPLLFRVPHPFTPSYFDHLTTSAEGVMTEGYSTDEADALVQADIVAAGYGK